VPPPPPQKPPPSLAVDRLRLVPADAGSSSAPRSTSVISPALAALDDFYAKPRGAAPDDGMVSLSSCTPAFDAWVKSTGRHDEFQPVPTSRYYRAETNHADGMGFSGDGLVGDARKPVTWYTQMITQGWLD